MFKILRKLNWFQYLLITGIVLIIFRNYCFFEFEMIGVYVSNAEEPILEMPEKGEKLYILGDGKYTSTSMSIGTYKIEGNTIKLSNGSQGWHLPLVREYNIGRPLIVLNSDLHYYLIKE